MREPNPDIAEQGLTASATGWTSRDDLRAFRMMLLIRRFEEKAGQLFGLGQIAGYCHLCIGQEAIAAGLTFASGPHDRRITGYRNHGHMLAMGVEPKRVMAELLGRAEGLSGGRGGSIHMFAPEQGFFGGHGLVGAQAPLGLGLAFASAYEKTGGVCFICLGDGAMQQGQVHESFALAAGLKLPVVFVIENNKSPYPEAHPTPLSLSQRGVPFGLPGLSIDGMDVRAVCHAASKAAAMAREGQPSILEMHSYRYRGHSMAEPARYRDPQDSARMREERDPINRLRERLMHDGGMSDRELSAIDRDIRAEIAEAVKAAEALPPAAILDPAIAAYA